jgi:hypothetical protein
MTRIENYRRRRTPWLAVLIVIGWLLLAAGIWHTAAHFAPAMRQIEMDLTDMQERMDAMLDELEAMRGD